MIRVQKVTKRYGSIVAVDGVSFEVAKGEITGFLGPNGAGKSTVLKMLSTYLPPDEGAVSIDGFDTQRESLAARRRLGYLTEHNALFEGMRTDRFLEFMGRARGLDGARLAERIAWVVDRCALEAVCDLRIEQCSKGYRQRIGLAASLIHDPPVLLLDEPTHGLDPLQVVAFRDLLHELRAERAILFSSHILSEVAEICDRLLVIQAGRLLVDSPLADLRAAAGRNGATLEEHVLARVRSAHPAEAEAPS